MTAPIRILIADDHPVVRSGLRALLESVEGLEVAALASDGREAVELALKHRPDVVVMDLHMPGLDGSAATRLLREQAPEVAVLVLTMFDDDDSVFAALRAGARGYLLKEAEPADVVRAIQAVSRGEAIFGPSIAQRMIDFFEPRRVGTRPEPFPDLTSREREVLAMIARGEANPVIARALMISSKTVRNHVSNIFTKLQVTDRTGAVLKAREAGLGEP